MSTILKIAWRNVWRQRRRTFLIAAAMGVIMSLLVLFDGVIVGFEQSIYGNAIQLLGGNIQVHAPGYSEETGDKPLRAKASRHPSTHPTGVESVHRDPEWKSLRRISRDRPENPLRGIGSKPGVAAGLR